MAFLQGNLALVMGIAALALTLALWRFARDEVLRRDVAGAARFFAIFVPLRLFGAQLEPFVPDDWVPFVRVTWMLAFAFGAVRLGVAVALWVRRWLRPGPTAKIQRDVLDFALYVLCALPIVKMQLKVDVTTLLGTSAVVSLVLGFALQDTLGNLFSGITLQFEQPFAVGDLIRVGAHEGRVVQVAWRSTRIETARRELITLPNSVVAKVEVVVLSAGPTIDVDLTLNVAFDAPPNRVKAEILETLREVPAVLAQPAPQVRVLEFADSAIVYQVRVSLTDFALAPQVRDEVLSRLWYRFGRAGIEIPFPQRVVQLKPPPVATRPPVDELLGRLELFAPFPAEELSAIGAGARERRYGVGEEIVTEGREGSTFFVVLSGRVTVRAREREVATLARGQSFGEMSLLTGEPRSATVIALEDTVLLELGRDVFATHFAAHPERAAQLAELLEQRKAALSAATAMGSSVESTRSSRVLERLREIFRLRA